MCIRDSNKPDTMRAERDRLLQVVASGAGFGAHEGALAPEEAVEQAALAGVGFAEDHGLHALAEHPAVAIRGPEAADAGREVRQSGRERRAVVRGQILVRKIDGGLDAGEQVDQPRDQLLQPAAQGAAELQVGGRSLRAPIRSATASAWLRSIRPLRNARFVNSPGSAGRHPRAPRSSSRVWAMNGLPCALISRRSSPE